MVKKYFESCLRYNNKFHNASTGQKAVSTSFIYDYVLDIHSAAAFNTILQSMQRRFHHKERINNGRKLRMNFYLFNLQQSEADYCMPISFYMVDGCKSSVQALGKLLRSLKPEPTVYSDPGYASGTNLFLNVIW